MKQDREGAAGAGSSFTGAGNAFTCFTQGLDQTTTTGASLLRVWLDKGDKLHSPLLSTVIQILQLFLFLSPQQLHSEVNAYKKNQITCNQVNQDLHHMENAGSGMN